MTHRLTLVVIGEERAPIDLPQQGRLVIGSGARAHVQLVGQGVADVHCAIGRIKGGGWALQDLGSEFGTLVNGATAETHRLEAGDELVLGSRRVRIVDPLRPAGAAVAPAAPASVKAPALERPAPRPSEPRTSEPRAAEPRALPVPRTEATETERAPVLGGYRIEDRLGRGAMGAVYLATQTSLHRPVALKVLSPKLASDPRFVERFQAEARAAAALNHPNVVTVYDVGSDGGHHYLAMEYMDGGSLEVRLDERGPMPWREVLDVLRDAASGLVYAEQRRIVHRDIKPENLMRNKEGVTKIADLGLAVQIDVEAQNEDHLSEGRRIFGTPHFIAPEVVRGGAADSRSDLYSLGATAYRLLSGHTPFEGASTREILRGVLNDPAPPLAERVPGLPAGVARLVHRLLEKEPAARFPSAQVTLDEIERLRRGETGGPVTLQPRPSRLPLVLGGIGVVVLALVAARIFGGGGSVDPGRGPGTNSSDGSRAQGTGDPHGTGAGETAGAGTAATGTSEPSSTSEQAPTGTASTDAPAKPTEAEFELRAVEAYLQLRDRELSEAERIEALRKLAGEFAGTDTARRALADADGILAARAESERTTALRSARKAELLAALRVAARFETDPFVPGRALREMRLVTGLAETVQEFGDDAEFLAARRALVDEVLEAGAVTARRFLASADAAAVAGDFEAMATHLRAVLPLGELPEAAELGPLVGADTPAGMATLRSLVATAQERLGSIGSRREELAARAARAAEAAAAEALGRGRGLEQDLRKVDLGAAATRLEGAATVVGNGPRATALGVLAADLRAAREVLSALGEGWSNPGWKRRAFADPRATGPRPVTAEAIGADADGVIVDAGGQPERLPWSAFASQPRTIESLVNGRLEREWTPAERRGIATLLRSAAALAAIDEALEVLMPDSKAKFSPGEGEALIAGYTVARDWAAGLGDAALLRDIDAEVQAAESLVLALRARSDGEWSRAAAAIERLLSQHGASLLVLLLSDGTVN
jgi:serine/threonine protein kinase